MDNLTRVFTNNAPGSFRCPTTNQLFSPPYSLYSSRFESATCYWCGAKHTYEIGHNLEPLDAEPLLAELEPA